MKCRENPRQTRRENPHKLFVEVLVHSTLDGVLEPIRFRTEQGARFAVSRVKNIQPAASQKAGGVGMKYSCAVVVETEDGERFTREIDLYHDGDFWFVEKEQLQSLIA